MTRQVTLITTGGTIEKTYDEATGELSNRQSLVRRMLGELRLEETQITVLELMSKDSLEMTDDDRRRISDAARLAGAIDPETGCDGVVILHGTDTLADTGERILEDLGDRLTVPVALTGAMRPFEMKRSDALQNLTEAIFATGVLEPGVYVVAHGQALRFPGVFKDRDRGTLLEGRGRLRGRAGRAPAAASEGIGVAATAELAEGVAVGLDGSGHGVGDLDLVLDVRQRAVEDPEPVVDRAPVQHLDHQLDVLRVEEPEGPGVVGQGRGHARAGVALEVPPGRLQAKAAVVQAQLGRRREAGAGGGPCRLLAIQQCARIEQIDAARALGPEAVPAALHALPGST